MRACRQIACVVAALVAAGPVAAAPPAPEPPPPRSVLAEAPRGARLGLLAVEARTGRVLAAHDADRPLLPASTAKLLTTACALDELGPARTFPTELRAARAPGPDGVLRGPLYVVGGGNPQLRFEDAWSMIRALHARGVSAIAGGLVGDDSVHEPAGRPDAWPASSRSDPFHAAQSGLALAWNAVEVVVRPGAHPGAPARVALFPLDAPVRVDNRATTGRATTIDVGVRVPDDGLARITVSGTIRAGAEPQRTWVRLGHPTLSLLATLDRLAREAGIAIEEPPRLGRVPAGTALLHRHESRPLAVLVADVNKYSSNFGAEILLRALDARAGTTAAGLASVRGCLARLGVPLEGVRLADGSGYARGNRLTARALVALLQAALGEPAWGSELVASLPRAAEDGSLSGRLSALRGRLRAKTGSLTGVRSLAGYAWTLNGEPVIFAVLLNGEGEAAARVSTAAIDRLVNALVRAADEGRREPVPASR